MIHAWSPSILTAPVWKDRFSGSTRYGGSYFIAYAATLLLTTAPVCHCCFGGPEICQTYANIGESCVNGCLEWCSTHDACSADYSVASYCTATGACNVYVFQGITAFMQGCGVDDAELYTTAYIPIFEALCSWEPVKLLTWDMLLVVNDMIDGARDCGEDSSCWAAVAKSIVEIYPSWTSWLQVETTQIEMGDGGSRRNRRHSRRLLSPASQGNVTVRIVANLDLAGFNDNETSIAEQKAFAMVDSHIQDAIGDGRLAILMRATGVAALADARPSPASSASAYTLTYASPVAVVTDDADESSNDNGGGGADIDDDDPKKKDADNSGMVAMSICGALVGVAGLAAAFVFWRKSKYREAAWSKEYERRVTTELTSTVNPAFVGGGDGGGGSGKPREMWH